MSYDLNVVIDKRLVFATEQDRQTAYDDLKAIIILYELRESTKDRCELVKIDPIPLKNPAEEIVMYKDDIVSRLSDELHPDEPKL